MAPTRTAGVRPGGGIDDLVLVADPLSGEAPFAGDDGVPAWASRAA